MGKVLKFIGALIILVLVIEFIMETWLFFAAIIAAYYGIRYYKNNKKPKVKIERKVVKEPVLKGNPDTIEYKMERLLTIAKLDDPNGAKRQNYLHKEQYNLRDYWYKYLDLRAKLALNNTPTNREEAVLHLMCDELLSRIDNLDVEATDIVKKEFIVTNLKPLLHDIVEIMEGIKPTGSIDINAYQLLQGAKYKELERVPVTLQK